MMSGLQHPAEMQMPGNRESSLCPSTSHNIGLGCSESEMDTEATSSTLQTEEGSACLSNEESSDCLEVGQVMQAEDCVKMKDEGELEDEDYSHLPSGPLQANLPRHEHLVTFDQLILDFMREQHIPGASLTVSKGGQLLYQQTYGWARQDEPVRPDHLFRIASVTKILTAVGAMKLYEEGSLKLGAKVFGPSGLLKQYYPSIRGDRRLLKVTVRHLLQHSGGWDRDEVGDPCFWRHVGKEMDVPEPVDQHTLIQHMMGQKLQFTPGSRYAYSNLGYVILGRVIEQVSGQTYRDYIRDMLLTIGIDRMEIGRTQRHEAHPDEVEYFANPTDVNVESIFPGGGQVAAPYGAFSVERGDSDGGWIATTKDLVTFLNAVDGASNQTLIKKKTFRMMLNKPNYCKGTSWFGMGLDVSSNRRAYEHGGHMDGSTAFLSRTHHGFTFAFLCNYWPYDSDYSSVIEYAINHVSGWSKVKVVHHPIGDAVTADGSHVIKLKIPDKLFDNVNSSLHTDGYALVWISGYLVKEQPFFCGLWIRVNTDKYNIVHKISLKSVSDMLHNKESEGFIPIHLDTYMIQKRLLCTIILMKKDLTTINQVENMEWTFKMFENLEEHENYLNTAQKQNWFPKCVSVINSDGDYQVAALYNKQSCAQGGGFWFTCNMTSSKYHAEFDKHARWGHLLTYVKAYKVGGIVNFAAVWRDAGSYLYSSEHDMCKHRFLVDFTAHDVKKYKPDLICGYEGEEGGHRFAAVYSKPVIVEN